MFTTQIGEVTVHFDFRPLIIFLLITAIITAIVCFLILFFHLIRTLVLEFKFRNITKKFLIGDYNHIIASGKKLLHIYQKYNARLSTKPLLSRVEYLNFSLAVSYFATSNDDQFLLHINELSLNLDIKEFWLSLFYLNKNDFENASAHYARIVSDDRTYVQRTFLTSFEAYKQGNEEIAKTKMLEILDKLTIPVLKKIADSVIKS